MSATDIRHLIVEELSNIAPEADFSTLSGHEDICEALEIDSMDFLNFIIALNKRTGKAIPEVDYPNFFTVDGAVKYLQM